MRFFMVLGFGICSKYSLQSLLEAMSRYQLQHLILFDIQIMLLFMWSGCPTFLYPSYFQRLCYYRPRSTY